MNIYWDGKSENLRVLLFLIDIYRYLKILKMFCFLKKHYLMLHLKSVI